MTPRLLLVAPVLVTGLLLAGCGAATTPAPTTSARPATTTTAPCQPRASQGTGGGAQLTVDPGTCLTGGQTVTVTGSGLKPNSPGGLAECNSASDQPTVTVSGSQVPVGCTNPLAAVATTESDGTLAATFTVVTGITGPPATGTDSAGVNALDDARNFPCPPTAAQIAAGATCTIAFGDASGDQLSTNISFIPNVKPSSTEPGSTLTTSVPIG